MKRCLLIAMTLAVVLLPLGCRPRLQASIRVSETVNGADGSVLLHIPAGPFIMGSTEYRDAKPEFTVDLPAYSIGKTEVTNRQFAAFVKATGYKVEGEWARFFRSGFEECPAVGVTWYDAGAYCRWAGLRLPSEAEWEKAARGLDARIYPWGNLWEPGRCNSKGLDAATSGLRMEPLLNGRGPVAVGSFADGASPYGALDMAGNAFEWTASAFLPYPYRLGEGREAAADPVEVALRGGGWAYDNVGFFRTDTRSRIKPVASGFFIGFRVAGPP